MPYRLINTVRYFAERWTKGSTMPPLGLLYIGAVLEKEGIDTPAINQISESYRRQFGESLPHPKMDALGESLTETFESGEKTLVFVRRVKSVDELVDKLSRRYDAWLQGELRALVVWPW